MFDPYNHSCSAVDNILIVFFLSVKIRLDISNESTTQMKYQVLFSLKMIVKIVECRLIQILCSALDRVFIKRVLINSTPTSVNFQCLHRAVDTLRILIHLFIYLNNV